MIIVYTAEWCSYCKKVKELLERKGLDFVEVDIFKDLDTIRFMQEQQHKTVPQVYIDCEHIGGYEATKNYL